MAATVSTAGSGHEPASEGALRDAHPLRVAERLVQTRRGVLGSAMAALGGGVLAACSAGGSGAGGQEAAKSAAPATVRFAAAGLGTELQVWNEVVETHNKLGNGITIVYEPCTAGSASAQDCLPVYFTQFVAGSAPDVWRVDDEPLPFYADKNMYRELDSLLQRDRREVNPDDFFPRAIAAMKYDTKNAVFGQGKLYGLPFNTGGDVLYVNKQLYKEAGIAPPPVDGNWTLNDFLEGARKITSLEGGGPLLRTAALHTRPTFRGNLAWLWAAGAEPMDKAGKWSFNRPENIRAYEWFVDLRRRHKVVPGPDDTRGAFTGNGFLNGRAGLWLSFPNNLRELYSRPQLDWDIVPFPKAANGQRYTRETADGMGMPVGGKQEDAAWRLVKWFCGGEAAKVFIKAGRAVPARRTAANSPEYLRPDTPQREDNIVKALDYSRLQPVSLMFNDAEVIIRTFENAMFDEKEPMPIQAALTQLQDVLDRLERDKARPANWEPRK
jgi:ABC-type glycerol-3-phosphate transport system substrate-binding protein